MEDEVLKDSQALLIQLRQLRLDIVNWMTKRLTRIGTNFPQYTVLAMLNEMGESTMGTLSGRLGITMGATTNLVDKLVHADCIERRRSQEDRRVVHVKVTDKGRDLVTTETAEVAKFLSRFFGNVSAEDRQTATRVVGRLVDLITRDSRESD